MANFCTRLVSRTLGLVPTVQPLIASMFIPGDAIALDSSADNSAADPPQANLVSPYAETLSTVTPLADAPKSLLLPSRPDVLPPATPPPVVEPTPILGISPQVEQQATAPSLIPSQLNSPAEISIQKSEAIGGESHVQSSPVTPPAIASPSLQTNSFIQKLEITGGESHVQPPPISNPSLQTNSPTERFIQKLEARGGESHVQPASVTPPPISSPSLQNSPTEKFIQKLEATGGESDVQPAPVTPAAIASPSLQTNSFIQKSEVTGEKSDIQPAPVTPPAIASPSLQTNSPTERFIQKSEATNGESDVQPAPVTPAAIASYSLQTNNTTQPEVTGFVGSQVEENTVDVGKSSSQNLIQTSSSEQPKLTETPISNLSQLPRVSGSIQPTPLPPQTGLAGNQSTTIQDVAADVSPTRKVLESVIPTPTPTHGVEKMAAEVKIETSANHLQKRELLTRKEERRDGVKSYPSHQSQLTPEILPQTQMPVSHHSLEADTTATANSESISAIDSRHPVTRRLSQRFFVGRSHSDSFHKSQTAISPISEKAGGRGAGSRGENTIVGTALISAPAAKVPELMSGYKEQPLLAERRQTVASSPTPTPTINITIGRVEVRGVNPPTPNPSTKAVRRSPALSLDNYLQQRNGSQR